MVDSRRDWRYHCDRGKPNQDTQNADFDLLEDLKAWSVRFHICSIHFGRFS